MGVAHLLLAARSGLRLPRRTARLRLTALYGGLFLLSGIALVAITYVLFQRATEYKTPRLPTIPHTAAIQHLQLPSPHKPVLPQGQSVVIEHPHQLTQAQQELGQAYQELAQAPPRLILGVPAELTRIRHQLAHAQDQLAQ